MHIDGFNLLPYLMGEVEDSPRRGFFYFNDDAQLVAMRFENWKIVYAEQRCRGTMQIWAEPFTELRVPKLFNLRTVPFEYADITSNTYYEWFMRRDFFAIYATAMASQFLDTFKEFPPRHPPASFSVDQIVEKLEDFLAADCMLESWVDGPTTSAIVDFVGRVTTEGPDFVPPEARIAVFDNDGTLWCEKPAYVQLDFLVRRLAEQAAADPALVARQPYTAAAEGDLTWFGDVVTKHYQGDDSQLDVLAGGMLSAYAGLTVDDHAARVSAFFADGTHPVLERPYTACGYLPMVELLEHVTANGFTNYVVSGGGRDFMRPITAQMYGIPPERVIGSSVGLVFDDGQLMTTATPEFFDDGPVKPVRIWGRTGRRPILAAGNSNGDVEMLQFTRAGTGPSLGLLVRHDDADREFDYVAGAERALALADTEGWTVASMRGDWITVFADLTAGSDAAGGEQSPG